MYLCKWWGRTIGWGGTFKGEESVCGTDVYEQCGRKEGRIFVRSKSLAGIEMNKSGIQEYEEIAEEGRRVRDIRVRWDVYNLTKQLYRLPIVRRSSIIAFEISDRATESCRNIYREVKEIIRKERQRVFIVLAIVVIR